MKMRYAYCVAFGILAAALLLAYPRISNAQDKSSATEWVVQLQCADTTQHPLHWVPCTPDSFMADSGHEDVRLVIRQEPLD